MDAAQYCSVIRNCTCWIRESLLSPTSDHAQRGGKSGGKYGGFGGLQGTDTCLSLSNLLIYKVARPISNPSLSANSCLAAMAMFALVPEHRTGKFRG
jgi:hypothetical protein